MAIQFEGLEEVLKRLSELADEEKAKRAINKATVFLEGEVVKLAPKDSGGLQESIKSRMDGLKGEVYTPLDYAPYVEYGTGLYAENGGRKEVPWVYVEGQSGSGRGKTIHTRQSALEAVAWLREQGLPAVMTYGSHPNPFMRPALDANRENIKKILGEALIDD